MDLVDDVLLAELDYLLRWDGEAGWWGKGLSEQEGEVAVVYNGEQEAAGLDCAGDLVEHQFVR